MNQSTVFLQETKSTEEAITALTNHIYAAFDERQITIGVCLDLYNPLIR